MTPSGLPLADWLPDLCALARKAGEAILEVYATDFAAAEKADRSPLTEADLAAHRVICEGLGRLGPALPVLSEEGVDTAEPAERGRWNAYWLVDPLDGTREFLKRNGEFTVNIALIEHHRPVLGVVGCPVQDLLYFGGPGLGAFRQRGLADPEPIAVQWPAQSPPRVVGSRSHAGDRLGGALERLGEHRLVPMGSSLKLCLVAAGEADLYPRLGPTSEWDTAAAHAVVAAAGGRVVDLAGADLRYNAKASLLNPEFVVCAQEPEVWLTRLGVRETDPPA
jgi:3'(2'), 5'-bisphosphate nucleotidase